MCHHKPDSVITQSVTVIIYLSCLPPTPFRPKAKKEANNFYPENRGCGIYDIATHKVYPIHPLLNKYVRSYRTFSPLPRRNVEV